MAMSFPDAPSAPIRHGASIAVFKHGCVLLVQRGRPPWPRIWSLPGGSIEAAELPHQAALRELAEETGVAAEIAGLLDIIEVQVKDESGRPIRYRLSVFYGLYLRGVLRAGSDAAAADWVALDDLEALALTEGTSALISLAARQLGVAPA